MTEKAIAKLSYEEAIEALVGAKTTVTEKRDELYAFLKTEKLKRNKDYSDDAKHGKKFSKFKADIDKLVTVREGLKDHAKASKPKKTGGRATSYEYPADIVSKEDKKKYRTKIRTEKAKAEKLKAKAEGGEEEEAPKAAKKETTKKKATSKKKAVSKKKEAVEEED